MKCVIHLLCPEHSNPWRQMAVDAAHPGLNRPVDLHVEMSNLGQGVHPPVRSASRGDFRLDACYGRDRCFDGVLQRIAERLGLPAMEGAAVVLQTDCDSHNIKAAASMMKTAQSRISKLYTGSVMSMGGAFCSKKTASSRSRQSPVAFSSA